MQIQQQTKSQAVSLLFFKGVFPDHGGRTKCLKPQLIKWIYTTSQEMKAIDIMKLRSNRFCLLFVLDPIHDCSSAHFQCYSNQLWISKWFLVAPVWLHVFSVYFIHEFLQQSLRWKEQRRMIVSRTFQFFFLILRQFLGITLVKTQTDVRL